jgi:hypothetical protein
LPWGAGLDVDVLHALDEGVEVERGLELRAVVGLHDLDRARQPRGDVVQELSGCTPARPSTPADKRLFPSGFPRIRDHYLLGADARVLAATIRRLLPGRALDAVITRLAGI